MKDVKLIRFDWAIKNILRDKSNFIILEGFLSELLNENITILEIIESESNKKYKDDKFNRVDLLVKLQKGELIIIEIQNDDEYDYFQRILYGVSKTISENLISGKAYKGVKKVISVNIVYFDLGHGKDYVYHGTTNFIGIHNRDKLELSDEQKRLFKKEDAYEIFPEYYILKIDKFDDDAKNGLDEWIYFLKNDDIMDNFKAKGLREAKEKLDVLKMSRTDRAIYEEYLEDLHYKASMAETERYKLEKAQRDGIQKGFEQGVEKGFEQGIAKGMEKGIEQGIEKGIEKSKVEIAKNLKNNGIDINIIISSTGLKKEYIENL